MRRMCPTHPTADADNCGWCEQAISRAEDFQAEVDDNGAIEAMERNYERYLDRIGGSA